MISAENFDAWFSELDKDGDGYVDLVEVAHQIKYLIRKQLDIGVKN